MSTVCRMIVRNAPSVGRREEQSPAHEAPREPRADAGAATTYAGPPSGATPRRERGDRADGLSQTLARTVRQRRPAASAALLQRAVEAFEGPQTTRGQEGLAYVFPGGAKQLYVDTDDNTLYFKSLQSTANQWVLIEVTPSEKDDPRAPEHKGYDRVEPERKRTIAPPKAKAPPVKPVEPPSPIAIELMEHTNHFYIRKLAGKVDELLGRNAIDLAVGDAIQLGGDTVEVRFSAREKGKTATVVEFVAHYHSEATGASTKAHHASQWHLKKWTNKWAHKDLEPSAIKYPNLFKLLPKRSEALSKPRAPKAGEPLYSPN
jgi:hypothetical protein